MDESKLRAIESSRSKLRVLRRYFKNGKSSWGLFKVSLIYPLIISSKSLGEPKDLILVWKLVKKKIVWKIGAAGWKKGRQGKKLEQIET